MKTYLKTLRAQKGISQAQLAEAVSVRRETISALEAGKYNPSLRLAWNICKTLGVSLEQAFDFSDET